MITDPAELSNLLQVRADRETFSWHTNHGKYLYDRAKAWYWERLDNPQRALIVEQAQDLWLMDRMPGMLVRVQTEQLTKLRRKA